MRPVALQWRLHTFALEDRNDQLKSELLQSLNDCVLPDSTVESAELIVNRAGARPISSSGNPTKVRRRLASLISSPELVSTLHVSTVPLLAGLSHRIDETGEGYGEQLVRFVSHDRSAEATAKSFDALCEIATLASAFEAAGFVEPPHNEWWPVVFERSWPPQRGVPVIPYYGWCLLLPAPLGEIALSAGIEQKIDPFEIREVVPRDGGAAGIAVRVPETVDDFSVEERYVWRDFLVDTFGLKQVFKPTEL